MEELRASEGQGQLGVWKDVSRFFMEDGLEGTELGALRPGKQLRWERDVCTRA